ncbi:hypothetical protein GCK32_000755 [Trichostrongylus colubriformis]|uniref:Uncharacterized protein n=1 Tax=Trichostrongylus colubriformis TaxID=6319 RepID=A0AAN8FT43_TRICO
MSLQHVAFFLPYRRDNIYAIPVLLVSFVEPYFIVYFVSCFVFCFSIVPQISTLPQTFYRKMELQYTPTRVGY